MPNMNEMFPSYLSDFELVESDSGRLVRKSSKSLLEAGNDDLSKLDMLDFLDCLLAEHPANLLTPLAVTAAVGQPVVELYNYIEQPTYDDVRLEAKRRLRDGRLHLHHVLDFMITLSGAVSFIHDLGFVHGDVRPRNIFVNQIFNPTLFDYNLVSRPFFLVEGYKSGNREVPPEANFDGNTMVDARYDIYELGYILRDLTHDFDHKSIDSYRPVVKMPPLLSDIVAVSLGPIDGRYGHAGYLCNDLMSVRDELI